MNPNVLCHACNVDSDKTVAISRIKKGIMDTKDLFTVCKIGSGHSYRNVLGSGRGAGSWGRKVYSCFFYLKYYRYVGNLFAAANVFCENQSLSLSLSVSLSLSLSLSLCRLSRESADRNGVLR